MQAQDPNRMLSIFLASMLSGGGATQESIHYDTETQARVPLIQAVLLGLGIITAMAGMWLLGGPVAWLAELASSRLDVVFLSALLVLVGVLWLGGLEAGLRRLKVRDSVVSRMALLVATVAGVCGMVGLVQLAAGNEATAGQARRLAGGVAVIIPALFLIWRFGNELINPLYPRPPSIEVMHELIERMQPQTQEVIVERPVPYRVNGHKETAEAEPATEAGPRLHPDFVDMVALVRRAAWLGWAREDHVTRPRLKMPSGRRLTRGLFDRLVDYAQEFEIIEAQDKGSSPAWCMDPKEATAYVAGAWRHQSADPLPEVTDDAT